MAKQPVRQLQANQPSHWFVGVDIGGTTVDTLLVDSTFTPHCTMTFPTVLTSPTDTLAGIRTAIQATLHAAAISSADVAAIGIGVPGQVDPAQGLVNLAVNLHWDHFPAGELLSAAFAVPCFLENDVRAAALGVYRFQNPEKWQNIAYVSIGTGVSAGLILQGQLYRGVHGMAGEFGHIMAAADGPRCNCGASGCLETFIAGPALALGRQAAQSDPHTALRHASVITAKDVYAAAQAGDTAASRIVEQAGIHLGRALQQLIMFYDVEWIVLGGGITRAGAAFLQPLVQEWERQRAASSLAQALLRPAMLHLLPADRRIGPWGALAIAEQGLRATRPSPRTGSTAVHSVPATV